MKEENTEYRYHQGLTLFKQEDLAARAVSVVCRVGLLPGPPGVGPLLTPLPWISRPTYRPRYRQLC
jgi:hypothetical protein